MSFVTLLLGEVVAWMRTQAGTGSLRAILYVDEVMGFAPPVANPPSKVALLTLLKQARACGLGVVLATQNPVDLDYKALSNAGTWLVGRLQTARDRSHVAAGLASAAASSGSALEPDDVEATLGRLTKRVFLMSCVHDDGPVVLHSRWTLSYLAGPLTRPQISALSARPGGDARAGTADSSPAPPASPTHEPRTVAPPSAVDPPMLPPGVGDMHLAPLAAGLAGDGAPTYAPRLLVRARLHHVSAKDGVNHWRDVALLVPVPPATEAISWNDAATVDPQAIREEPAPPGAMHVSPPAGAVTVQAIAGWAREAEARLVEAEPLRLQRARALREVSRPGEREGDFRARLSHAARERRDAAVEKLRGSHAPKLARLQARIRAAESRVDRERQQASHQTTQTAISVGATIVGALFGRKGGGMGTVGRAATAARGATRAAREREDIARAEEDLSAVREDLARLEAAFAEDSAAMVASLDPTTVELEPVVIPPRKADLDATVTLAWVPGGPS